jgi:hypothetical protein
MDFRVLHVSRLIWNAATGKLQYPAPGRRKYPIVQFPPTTTRMYPGESRCTLQLTPLHPQFAQWYMDFAKSARDGVGDLSEDTFRGLTWDDRGIELSFFGGPDDLSWFGPDKRPCKWGDVVEPGTPFISSCLVQMKGIWRSASSWGLIMDIQEIQVHEDEHVRHEDTAWCFREEDVAERPPCTSGFEEFMFLNDEPYN